MQNPFAKHTRIHLVIFIFSFSLVIESITYCFIVLHTNGKNMGVESYYFYLNYLSLNR